MELPLSDQPALPHEFNVPATVGRRLAELGVAALWGLFTLLDIFPPSHEKIPLIVILVSAATSLHFLARALDGRDRLTVTEEGILDRTSIVGGDLFVRWDEVTDVRASRSRWVELQVSDLDAVAERADWRRRWAIRAARLIGKKTITIMPVLLGLNGIELGRRLDDGLLVAERKQLGLPPEEPEALPARDPGASEDEPGALPAT